MATVISILIAAVGADTSSREEQIYPCTTSDVEDDGVRLDLTDCVWISDAGKSRRDACGELCTLVLVVSEPGSCVLGSAVEMKVAGRRHGHARIHRSSLVPESRHVEVNGHVNAIGCLQPPSPCQDRENIEFIPDLSSLKFFSCGGYSLRSLAGRGCSDDLPGGQARPLPTIEHRSERSFECRGRQARSQ